jgi:peptidoglycan/xylan/chitin deacetylase (PgdA/CDA1 family)
MLLQPRPESAAPPLIAAIQRLIRAADCRIARAYLSLFGEGGGLLVFLFHSLFRDEREIALNHVDPLERTTVGRFRRLLEYYLDHGYRFISPDDLPNQLEPGGKYALISFDDGYYNNVLALPVLEEYRAPALFFISTDHVRENKAFWWDVLYRERTARGASPRQVGREGLEMKAKTSEQIEAQLRDEFGAGAFTPHGDIDRPFAPAELRDFARSPHVSLGNHTANHAILTNYTPDQARAQIRTAQESLTEWTGVCPRAIAYPNGASSDAIIPICRDLGLELGFTITPVKNRVPVDPGSPSAFRLGRFTPHHEISIEIQCRTYRSDVLLYSTFRSAYLRLVRGHGQRGRKGRIPGSPGKEPTIPCPTVTVPAAAAAGSS